MNVRSFNRSFLCLWSSCQCYVQVARFEKYVSLTFSALTVKINIEHQETNDAYACPLQSSVGAARTYSLSHTSAVTLLRESVEPLSLNVAP